MITVALELPGDLDDLVEWLTGQPWPFHADVPLTAEEVRARAGAGHWGGEATRTFWVLEDGRRVALVRLGDVGQGTPMFDLRVDAAHRGRGLGSAVVHWLSRYLFVGGPSLQRIEATTRQDNAAMRAVLARCGFVKEAHYRRDWPTGDGRALDSIGYGLLRQDWVSGAVTPVDWSA